MDEVEVESKKGMGTRVIMKKTISGGEIKEDETDELSKKNN